MPTRRKALIAIGGSVALAGCSEAEPEPDPEPETEEDNNDQSIEDLVGEESDDENTDPVEEPISETETILNQNERRVDGGEYFYWSFEIYRAVELNLRTTVRQGSEVDINITSLDEFDQFERGNRYRFYDDISQQNTTGDDTSQRIGEGQYIVFIYNRTRQTASVDIELTANE